MKWFRKWREEQDRKTSEEDATREARVAHFCAVQDAARKRARRERIATAALTGVLANPDHIATLAMRVDIALLAADALIAELDKQP